MYNHARGRCIYSMAVIVILLFALHVPAGQSQDRFIRKFSRPDEPVEITAVKVRGKPRAFGKTFTADNDWIGSISITVKNVSSRNVRWLSVALDLPKDERVRTSTKGPPYYGLREPLVYGIGLSDEEKLRGGGPPLRPGESVEILYPAEIYKGLRELMDGMSYPKSVSLVVVSVEKVLFEGDEDVMWIEGKMNRRNYKDPRGWSPINR